MGVSILFAFCIFKSSVIIRSWNAQDWTIFFVPTSLPPSPPKANVYCIASHILVQHE